MTLIAPSAVPRQLPFTDRTEFESVCKGLIAPSKGQVKDASGKVFCVLPFSSYK
ncbi:hypothetical protein [Pseudomonas sp. R37(2017)]|uniref:hypothetical protein n=1 Tax=Pseudomonas sp. R37(2017) TaxID=1981685 RepID=UPI001302E01D|nr:hypothetical protein [Pseudomonas sp. R37(2017)]